MASSVAASARPSGGEVEARAALLRCPAGHYGTRAGHTHGSLLAKTGSNDRYSIFNVHSVDTCKSALENYKSGKSKFAPELLVFFFVNGNKGYRY